MLNRETADRPLFAAARRRLGRVRPGEDAFRTVPKLEKNKLWETI